MSQDTRNEIRAMDADGVPRAEIARRLGLSRNTVAKYADMEDMSPAAPVPAPRERPALEGNGAWVESVLEADAGAPRKQRHTARRIYDRLVEERGFEGSYSTVRRFVRDWRPSRAPGPGEGYLELEWRPGTCQVDYGNFRATVAGEPLELKLLVATLPHPDDRQCVATRSQRSECMCAGLAEIFGRWGRAPRLVVLDNATEAGRMVRGEVTESALFSQFKGHYRFESRYCNPYSGNEKGSVENAVGFLRRNLLVPVPSFGSMAELNRSLAEGCARLNASARCRDGRPSGEALREDLSEMRALPGVAFDAVRWVPVRADKRGYVEVDGREYVARPGLARQAPARRRAGRHGGDPGRQGPQGGRAAQGLRRGPGGAQPAVARARPRSQAPRLRGVHDQARHARRPGRGHRPDGRGGAPAGAALDIAGKRGVGLRGGLQGRAARGRGRQGARRRDGGRAGEAHSRRRWRRPRRAGPGRLRRVPQGGGRRWPLATRSPGGCSTPAGRAR